MLAPTPQPSNPPSQHCLGFSPLILILILLAGAPCVEAGGRAGVTVVTPHVGSTYRTIAPTGNPDVLSDTTNPQTLLLGLNVSRYLVAEPVFVAGAGLGLYLDDGAFAVDLVPKIGTLLGAMGFGMGITLRDGDLGFVTEGWFAVLAGLRWRRTWIEKTERTSLSLFVAAPMRL